MKLIKYLHHHPLTYSSIKIALSGFIAASIFFVYIAHSSEGVYEWKVLEVVDGDTIKVEIPNLPVELKMAVRVKGIDTPEKGNRAKCSLESTLGLSATYFTQQSIKAAKKITFSDIKWDKYGGRVVAVVKIDGKNLADELLSANLAKVYDGGKKEGWCK